MTLTRDRALSIHGLFVLSLFLIIIFFAKSHPSANYGRTMSAIPGFQDFPLRGWTTSVPTFILYAFLAYYAMWFGVNNKFPPHEVVLWTVSVAGFIGIFFEWATNIINIVVHDFSYRFLIYSGMITVGAVIIAIIAYANSIHLRLDKVTLCLIIASTGLYVWWIFAPFPHISMNVLGYSNVNPQLFPWGWEDINMWIYGAYPNLFLNTVMWSYIIFGVKIS